MPKKNAAKPLTVNRAKALALALSGRSSTDPTRGAVRVRVDEEAGRLVFEHVELVRNAELGGLWHGDVLSRHSIDVRTSTEARAVAHFEGFCEAYGLGVSEGDTVLIACGSSPSGSRTVRVLEATRRRFKVFGRYAHGGTFERWAQRGEVSLRVRHSAMGRRVRRSA